MEVAVWDQGKVECGEVCNSANNKQLSDDRKEQLRVKLAHGLIYLSAAEPVALGTEMSTLKSSADGDFLAVALLEAWFGETSSVTSQP